MAIIIGLTCPRILLPKSSSSACSTARRFVSVSPSWWKWRTWWERGREWCWGCWERWWEYWDERNLWQEQPFHFGKRPQQDNTLGRSMAPSSAHLGQRYFLDIKYGFKFLFGFLQWIRYYPFKKFSPNIEIVFGLLDCSMVVYFIHQWQGGL